MPTAPLTPVELLALVGLGERPRYGYELVERISELSGGRVEVRPGNLYRVIHRLEDRGLVGEVGSPSDAESAHDAGSGPPRQYFATTAKGRRVAATELAMYRGIAVPSGSPGSDPTAAPGEA